MWVTELKHLIIGAGVIGKATGLWLKANNEEVAFHDKNNKLLLKLEKEGLTTTLVIEQDIDIYWICTAEWNVEEVVYKICQVTKQEYSDRQKIIVIRSTTPPGTVKDLCKRFKLRHVAHNPEFLRAKMATEDIFNPDRILIGTDSDSVAQVLKKLYSANHVPIVITDPTTSELIKYSANCWLATQISYWNEIKKICNKFNVNPQMVANASCLDKRISKYGTAMIGEPFSGFCLPKDLDALIKSFEGKDIDPVLLKAVRKVNEQIKKEKMGKGN